jgi:hypothetical protein
VVLDTSSSGLKALGYSELGMVILHPDPESSVTLIGAMCFIIIKYNTNINYLLVSVYGFDLAVGIWLFKTLNS